MKFGPNSPLLKRSPVVPRRFCLSLVQSFMKVLKSLYPLKIGLRLYPPVTTLHPRITPHEGMIIDGHFIHGNVRLYFFLFNSRRRSAVQIGQWSTIADTFQTRTLSFLRDGSKRSADLKLVRKPPGSLFCQAGGAA